MSVMPALCSVTAVVSMIENAIAFENVMPSHVSILMRRRWSRAPFAESRSGSSPAVARCSSTSCDACQKNRYGLIVVPSTATSSIR